jgi:hypothetical protein
LKNCTIEFINPVFSFPKSTKSKYTTTFGSPTAQEICSTPLDDGISSLFKPHIDASESVKKILFCDPTKVESFDKKCLTLSKSPVKMFKKNNANWSATDLNDFFQLNEKYSYYMTCSGKYLNKLIYKPEAHFC